jgi:hypothetical protein
VEKAFPGFPVTVVFCLEEGSYCLCVVHMHDSVGQSWPGDNPGRRGGRRPQKVLPNISMKWTKI